MARRHRRARARTTAGATAAIKRATGVAEASLTQPGQPALDPKTFEGETIKKDVTVKASFKSPEGQASEKTLVVTIERVAGGGREGRPIITKISGTVRLSAPSAARRVFVPTDANLHDQLLVVFEIFHAHNRSGPELGVRDARAGP